MAFNTKEKLQAYNKLYYERRKAINDSVYRGAAKEYYKNNKDKVAAYKTNYRRYKRECKRLADMFDSTIVEQLIQA